MNKNENNKANTGGERIAKVIARAGVCSRRDAEKLIAEGRVSLNGKTLDTPAIKVTNQDSIEVDGKTLNKAEETRLFMYHKPVGLLTTSRDERGRDTIYKDIPKSLPRLVTVGRLDLNTQGLLLLTNDGGLSRHLELPSTGLKRTYRVRVFGHVRSNALDRLKEGITYEGVNYGSIDASFEKNKGQDSKTNSRNTWIKMTLTEGKNREIRNVMRALDLQVNKLIRVSYGPFELSDLGQSEIIEVPNNQIAKIYKK